MEQLWTVEQLAERLKIDVSIAGVLLQSDEIHASKVDGEWRVAPAEVAAFVQREALKEENEGHLASRIVRELVRPGKK